MLPLEEALLDGVPASVADGDELALALCDSLASAEPELEAEPVGAELTLVLAVALLETVVLGDCTGAQNTEKTKNLIYY